MCKNIKAQLFCPICDIPTVNDETIESCLKCNGYYHPSETQVKFFTAACPECNKETNFKETSYGGIFVTRLHSCSSCNWSHLECVLGQESTKPKYVEVEPSCPQCSYSKFKARGPKHAISCDCGWKIEVDEFGIV